VPILYMSLHTRPILPRCCFQRLTGVCVRGLWQMGQFAFIFVQSVLAYLEGPLCGSPDFSKLLSESAVVSYFP
jgi:hypothetical protein